MIHRIAAISGILMIGIALGFGAAWLRARSRPVRAASDAACPPAPLASTVSQNPRGALPAASNDSGWKDLSAGSQSPGETERTASRGPALKVPHPRDSRSWTDVPVQDHQAVLRDQAGFRAFLREIRSHSGDRIRACQRSFRVPPRASLRPAAEPSDEPFEAEDRDFAALVVSVVFSMEAFSDGLDVADAQVADLRVVYSDGGKSLSAPIADDVAQRCIEGAYRGARVRFHGIAPGTRSRMRWAHWIYFEYPQEKESAQVPSR